jgi:hypothetical protein
MEKTFKRQIFRSSKHRKKLILLKPVHYWIRIVDEKHK